MKQSNINFLSFSSDFKLPMFILHLNYSCLIYFCSFFVNFKRIIILHRVLRKKGIVTSNVIQVYDFVLYFYRACAEMTICELPFKIMTRLQNLSTLLLHSIR